MIASQKLDGPASARPDDALLAADAIAATVQGIAGGSLPGTKPGDILCMTLKRLDKLGVAAGLEAANYIRALLRQDRSSVSTLP